MIQLPYWARLLCACAASGLVCYAAGAAVSAAAAPWVQRRAQRRAAHHPGRAAAWVLTWRLLPLLASFFAVVFLCLPSYLLLESQDGAEAVGRLCCLVAAVGLCFAVANLWRMLRAGLATRRYRRWIARQGEGRQIGGHRVQVLPAPAPSMALSGAWKPLLTVSRPAFATLTPQQLEAGLEHERAHLRARDNLKRLLLLATPVPGQRHRSLHQTWARLAEWAADDFAAAGDPRRSLLLASTLVAVARLRPDDGVACGALTPLLSTLHGARNRDLIERVERLLKPRFAPPARRAWLPALAAA
ncbi:MAG TPA: hypothetical protein VFP94_05680, partial [Terriglobales bacterium]|nr:hypothetical protein [Terriglobales bacterium]